MRVAQSREVLVESPGGQVALLVIDRPEARNALGWETWRQLREALEAIGADETIRAVVLTGNAGVFSSGGDLKTAGPRGRGVTAPGARLRLAHDAVCSLRSLAKPTIAAVAGYAIGAAWGLVLACDLVVAERDAFFLAPFVPQRALVPDAGVGWFLTRSLGPHRAAQLLLGGERVPAGRAAELGLVNEVVEPGEARPRALEMAARLASGPPDTMALTKDLLRRAADTSLEDYLGQELLAMTLNSYGPDAAEGRAAFLEKRNPSFSPVPEQ